AYNPAAELEPPDPTPAKTRTEFLFQALKLTIVRGAYRPGDRLTEEGIAAQYAMSRTPVRECFRRLGQEGLLSHLSYGGYTVRAIDFEEMTELYEVRVALEELSAARASGNASAECLDRLAAFWSQPPQPGSSADIDVVYAD